MSLTGVIHELHTIILFKVESDLMRYILFWSIISKNYHKLQSLEKLFTYAY